MKKVVLALPFLLSVMLSAQKDYISVFGGVAQQEVAKRNQLGAELNVKYYISKYFALGGQMMYGYKNYHHGFGYKTDRTRLAGSNIAVVVQYDFLTVNRLEVGATLGAGLKTSTLRNLNDISVEEQYDQNGVVYYVEQARLLNQDNFFSVTPGFSASYRLANLGDAEKSWLLLTLNAGYQQNFGTDHLLRINNPHGFMGSVGITIKSYTKTVE